MAEKRGPSQEADNIARLTEMWSSVTKALTPVEQPQDALTTTISITFDGGAQAVSAGLGGVVQISFPCRLLSATMYAGSISTYGVVPTPVTATVWLGLGRRGTWVNGVTEIFAPDIPTLTEATEAELLIDDWITEFQPNDVIAYSLQSFVGTATFVAVELVVRRLPAIGVGVFGLTDNLDGITDDGERVTVR